MTPELCLAQSDMASLREQLLGRDTERCAVMYAGQSVRRGGQLRLLVREIEFALDSDYTAHSAIGAQLSPLFVARLSERARKDGLSLVFVHTHLERLVPAFSHIDDEGELRLSAFLHGRGVEGPHAALVLSEVGAAARLLGAAQEMRVVALGAKRVVEAEPEGDERPTDLTFDRQVRAFGAAGQKQLEKLHVAIVGLGGTGSIMAQQLVHLGIRKFTLIDPDDIELTNLNRVVNAAHADLHSKKAAIAARYIRGFDPEVSVEVVAGDVVLDSVARRLIDADLIMACTDSHGSRSVIQQVAYQYLIPCIDVGSTIIQAQGVVKGIYGRVQLLSPGLPCLWCSELLNAAEVRRDMMSTSERKLDPYITGSHEPAPSVISLNGTVVSLAVTMLLGIAVGAPIDSTRLVYNACVPTLRAVSGQPQRDCFICSKKGALAWGDRRGLLTRLM